MDSEGLWTDLRHLVLRGDVFRLAIAVLVGTAIFQFLYAAFTYLVIPFAGGVIHRRDDSGLYLALYTEFNGYTIAWGEVLGLAITLVAATLLLLLFRRQFGPSQEEDEEESGLAFEDSDFQACPECLSQIPAAARRCAFCTAEVLPSTADEQE